MEEENTGDAYPDSACSSGFLISDVGFIFIFPVRLREESFSFSEKVGLFLYRKILVFTLNVVLLTSAAVKKGVLLSFHCNPVYLANVITAFTLKRVYFVLSL